VQPLTTTSSRFQQRYALGEALGEGGMSEVLAATDTRLGRPVAVKLLRPELAEDERRREAFESEARAAASLSHPNIVRVYDIGEHAGRPFIVMERLSGRTLADEVAEGPMEVERACRLAHDVLMALDVAHRAGIVHCDIKPSNVLLAGETAKVADFGIARAGAGLEKATGELFGTPAYVAPERLVGMPAAPATDVYSLGVMLYQMLTGEPPFRGESAGGVLRAVRQGAHRPLHVVRPDAGPALCHTVERAMATRPSDRFASAFEMASSLPSARALREGAGRTPLPPPLPLADQTRALVVRPQRRAPRGRRVVVPVAALAAALGLVFAVVASSGGGAPEPAPTTTPVTAAATSPPTTAAPVVVRPPAVQKPAKGARH
jgi:serine/threonine protein kinase